MRIGVPKEIKNNEFRVGLTPGSVQELVANGHQLIVEQNCGAAIGFSDDQYRVAGAKILESAQEVFDASEMIVKVKEPQPQECKMLREGQLLFTFLHLAPDPIQTDLLLASGATCVAYETVTDATGALPLLAPMSEVAGRISIQAGAHHLENPQGGSGVLLGGVPGVAPGNVLIIGGGVVGTHAARMAVGLGAQVTILDRSLSRLRELDELFAGRATTRYSTGGAIRECSGNADLVIGAVLIPGAAAPKLLRKEHLETMRPGSVVVDVAIDQGGCFETSKATTYQNPTYVVDGIIHYCVANMPGGVARTSTLALNNATLPFAIELANKGVKAAMARDSHLLNGLNIHQGKLTYQAVGEALGLDYVPATEALNL